MKRLRDAIKAQTDYTIAVSISNFWKIYIPFERNGKPKTNIFCPFSPTKTFVLVLIKLFDQALITKLQLILLIIMLF